MTVTSTMRVTSTPAMMGPGSWSLLLELVDIVVGDPVGSLTH